jgi:hypothetical protein
MDSGAISFGVKRHAKQPLLGVISIQSEPRGKGQARLYDSWKPRLECWRASDGGGYRGVLRLGKPGEAYQFDWSHEIGLLGGVPVTVKVPGSATAACCSRVPIRVRRKRGCFDTHDRAVAFFNGKYRRGIYDKMKTAVRDDLVGRDSLYDRHFLQMCSHYLVEPVACTPASGWRRGRSRTRLR